MSMAEQTLGGLDAEGETAPVYSAFNEELGIRLKAALECNFLADTTFVVGKGNELRSFRVSKLLMCAVSPVLNAMLNSSFRESKMDTITLEDDSPLGFELLCQFAYSDIVELTTMNVFDTLQMASKYQIKRLEDDACRYLQSEINWKEALQMLLSNSDKKFALEACLRIFAFLPPYQLTEMLESMHFLCSVTLPLMETFVKSDYLQVSEELIWEACLKWNHIQNYIANNPTKAPLNWVNPFDTTKVDPKTIKREENYNIEEDEKLGETVENLINLEEKGSLEAITIGDNDPIRKLVKFIRWTQMSPKYFARMSQRLLEKHNLLALSEIVSLQRIFMMGEEDCDTTSLGFILKGRETLSSEKLATKNFKLLSNNNKNRVAKPTVFTKNQLMCVEYDFTKSAQKPANDGWIGLIPASCKSRAEAENDDLDRDYFRIDGMVGRGYLMCNDIGDFEIRAFDSDENGQQIEQGIKISLANADLSGLYKSGNVFEIDRNVVYHGEYIAVRFDFNNHDNNPEPCSYGSGWIGIVPANIDSREEAVNDNHDINYFHVPGVSGQSALHARRSGEYNVKCFSRDNGGQQIGDSIPLTIMPLQPGMRGTNRVGE